MVEMPFSSNEQQTISNNDALCATEPHSMQPQPSRPRRRAPCVTSCAGAVPPRPRIRGRAPDGSGGSGAGAGEPTAFPAAPSWRRYAYAGRCHPPRRRRKCRNTDWMGVHQAQPVSPAPCLPPAELHPAGELSRDRYQPQHRACCWRVCCWAPQPALHLATINCSPVSMARCCPRATRSASGRWAAALVAQHSAAASRRCLGFAPEQSTASARARSAKSLAPRRATWSCHTLSRCTHSAGRAHHSAPPRFRASPSSPAKGYQLLQF